MRVQVDLEPHEPYSPPSNMYLWWGPSTNHRFVGSGEHIRHLLHMGQVCTDDTVLYMSTVLYRIPLSHVCDGATLPYAPLGMMCHQGVVLPQDSK